MILMPSTFIAAGLLLAGCETTNSIPYKASTENIITIQQQAEGGEDGVQLGIFSVAPNIDESPICRLSGPIRVAPGKSIPDYIKDALQEELFAANLYDTKANNIIEGSVENIEFSSVSPASWKLSLKLSSKHHSGYTTSIKYPFETSWTAYSACKNVANAFGPAVQELIHDAVKNPEFKSLINNQSKNNAKSTAHANPPAVSAETPS